MSQAKYQVQLYNYEGPLDLLLQLIDNNQLNISDISIAKVTGDYLQTIKQIDYDHHSANSFLILAVRLIRLKAQMLLNTDNTDDETLVDSLSLSKQLKTLHKYKLLAKKLSDNFAHPMLTPKSKRNSVNHKAAIVIQVGELKSIYQDLLRTAVPVRQVMRLKKKSSMQLRKSLLQQLEEKQTYKLEDLTLLTSEPKETITLFLLLLELIKSQKAHYDSKQSSVEIGGSL